MSTVQKMIGIAGFVFVLALGVEDASGGCPEYPEGFTCECNAAFTEWVCADWAAPGTPTHNADFTVVYDQSGLPDVTLSVADLGWELYSEVISTGFPADMGALTLSDTGADDYKVKIANGGFAGADVIGSVVLDDAGFTGFSSIAAGSSTAGDINGALKLVEDDAGLGGVLGGFIVSGDVAGLVTLPKVTGTNRIFGSVDQDVTIGEINDGSFDVFGLVDSGVSIQIDEMVDGSVELAYHITGFCGDLILSDGLSDSGSSVRITNFGASANIDLSGEPVAGNITIFGESLGDILDGGRRLRDGHSCNRLRER